MKKVVRLAFVVVMILLLIFTTACEPDSVDNIDSGSVSGDNPHNLFPGANDVVDGGAVEGSLSEVPPMPGDPVLADIIRMHIDGTVKATVETFPGEETIRMIGVDFSGQDFDAADNHTLKIIRQHLLNNNVEVEFDIESRNEYGALTYTENRNEDGELMCYVFLKDGTFFNEYLLSEGIAKFKEMPPHEKYNDILIAAEETAKQEKRGIWA
jgi:hypothetical protein